MVFAPLPKVFCIALEPLTSSRSYDTILGPQDPTFDPWEEYPTIPVSHLSYSSPICLLHAQTIKSTHSYLSFRLVPQLCPPSTIKKCIL